MASSPADIASPLYPLVGTFIEDDALQLVEILSGRNHGGIVYRAVNTSGQKSYAVKCLVASASPTAGQNQRQIYMQEIKLHQLTSTHPGVITLHRIFEQDNHIYLVMAYAPDHDLSTQIFQSCRYLGINYLIKDIFLQLIDAVDYCHSFGIYHRYLKPKNIVCFEDGFRIAITDFSLATMDKLSDEFCIGSIWYMSLECQGEEFAPTGKYSPRFNDVWSLGIILLNIITGRIPWESATPDNPNFGAYLSNPFDFLTTAFPISSEVNDILIRMLHIDWRERIALHEVHDAVEGITNFYSDDVGYVGYMAYRSWEIGCINGKFSATKTIFYSGDPKPGTPVNTTSYSATTQGIQMYANTVRMTEFKFPVKVPLDDRQSTVPEDPPLSPATPELIATLELTLPFDIQTSLNTGTTVQTQAAHFTGPQPVHSNDSTSSITNLPSNPHSSVETSNHELYYTRQAISQDSLALNSETTSIGTCYSNPYSSNETLTYGLYYTRHAISQDSMALVGW